MKYNSLFFLVFVSLVFFSCSGSEKEALDTDKTITSFTIAGQLGSSVITNTNELVGTITVTMPYGTVITALTPIIEIEGARVSPASEVAENFTNPVLYTVTADDGSKKEYTVTVSVLASDVKDITSFTIPNQVFASQIINTNELIGAITVIMPYVTVKTALIPSIEINGASVSPASGVAENFTNPLVYTVTAEDGSKKEYTVTVTLEVGDNATLKASSKIKGITLLSLGTPDEVLNNTISGTVTISTIQATDISNTGSFVTLFEPTKSGAIVNKVVKYLNGASTSNFEADEAYNNEAILNNDFFVIKVRSENEGKFLYYKIIVTVVAVGDNFQGGKLAYVLQSGDQGFVDGELHGFIATLDNQSTSAEWGCKGTEIEGADGTAIGTGLQNTIDLMNGCSTAGIAGRLCRGVTINGYSDWYLPSKDELNIFYLKRAQLGNFGNVNLFWSSSEYEANKAKGQLMRFGFQLNYEKTDLYFVRCARSF